MLSLTVDQNEQICRLIVEAGQQALSLGETAFQVYEKGRKDYVTSVDRVLDLKLSSGLAGLFPEDSIVTEENDRSQQAFQDGSRRLWLIDPIDGTDNFIRRGESYAVMVGLLQGYRPVAGWVYAPTQQRLYWGGADWGLFSALDGQRPQLLKPVCPASVVDEFCPILLGYRDQQRYGDAIAHHLPLAQCQSIGSFGLKVLDVIQGRAGLYVYLNRKVKPWDTAGPLALALAAGLTCCDLEGQSLRWDVDAVDGQTLIHQQTILIGWPHYIQRLRQKIKTAVQQTNQA